MLAASVETREELPPPPKEKGGGTEKSSRRKRNDRRGTGEGTGPQVKQGICKGLE